MQQIKKSLFRSGTSGLVLPVPNKQFFPPAYQDKSRLCYYSSLFNSIEVNSSFYKIPQGATVKKWADSVTEDFVFTFKLWREITHVKGLAYNPADIPRFLDVIDNAGPKKGCLLVQFPPSVTVDLFAEVEQLLEILQDNTRAHDWKVALEFRHPSWYIGEVYELADEYSCSIVLHDIPKSRNTQLNKQAGFVYLRFHGPTGDYRGGYTDAFLQEQAARIGQWTKAGKAVYVYFNNTAGDAVSNLMTLNKLVAATGT
ncbi:DUF72 domain-containing protein [Chitinophaga agrisoli]|uniref:DUF72 domain-containing protein n=1 Tax=Chitinophaga agrisoli TaxID=2607653 RepID=A0A5B2VXK2_9BACT|nr:DUF72 domain-containing protein [Chitinophaga agrisoli]KAA2243330.1 DUF72 domain-containing protein [Chitinophaga agrisoli]